MYKGKILICKGVSFSTRRKEVTLNILETVINGESRDFNLHNNLILDYYAFPGNLELTPHTQHLLSLAGDSISRVASAFSGC